MKELKRIASLMSKRGTRWVKFCARLKNVALTYLLFLVGVIAIISTGFTLVGVSFAYHALKLRRDTPRHRKIL